MSDRWSILVSEAARDLRRLNSVMLIIFLFARAAGWLVTGPLILAISALLLLGSYFLALGCLPGTDDTDGTVKPRWKRLLLALAMSVAGISLPVVFG
ncbi:hypothetical protein [Endozoicomonas euniceicola]|uniref:DUF202 domain-containing protein n=1 Tax=Endozoicomonas euniceicola TaxID=1234143 RepID=A0ABY6GR13_9GAMM|nr:hypothetical protein [Endozoicomonas euniceicola]UYM15185.1 hypothetical protein NX720_20330 [Endozoicomonas euniceicola]